MVTAERWRLTLLQPVLLLFLTTFEPVSSGITPWLICAPPACLHTETMNFNVLHVQPGATHRCSTL